MELEEQKQVAKALQQVHHDLFLFLCPFEEGEEVQPAVEPNVQEDAVKVVPKWLRARIGKCVGNAWGFQRGNKRDLTSTCKKLRCSD